MALVLVLVLVWVPLPNDVVRLLVVGFCRVG
jgi:hypothetical protein